MPKILIADDHPLFRQAMRLVLDQVFGDAREDVCCLESSDFSSALAVVEADESLDLLLLDLWMPGSNGLSGIVTLRTNAPWLPILVVSSACDEETVQRALAFGVMGYIGKSAPCSDIAAAIEMVMAGGVYDPFAPSLESAGGRSVECEALNTLTPRQLKVLELLAEGKPNKQIAYELSISQMTVKAHLSTIFRKLNVTSRAQAIVVTRQLHSDGQASSPARRGTTMRSPPAT